MRILGFSKKWAKLNDKEFTTFRVPRKDRDWDEGEAVKIVYHPRSKDHESLGTARILEKTTTTIGAITNDEAYKDGFPEGRVEMWRFMMKSHKGIHLSDKINKLFIRWLGEEKHAG